MNKIKILIIGRIPPPIGGVTVHTTRLLKLCEKENLQYSFFNLKQFTVTGFLMAIKRSKIAHMHASSPLILLFFTLSCRLFKTKSIITIHHDINIYNNLLSIIQKLAIRFSNIPIVLNNNSLQISKRINKNTKLISAFIPPIDAENLNSLHRDQINNLIINVKLLFCSNAYDLVYDKFGREIYGILPLVELFNLNPSIGLIISDPKGSYMSYFNRNKFTLGNNITILTGEHPFFEVLKLSDCYIRNTTTDGDSLSINEALYFGINVIATNCVDRPEGVEVIITGNVSSLENSINKITKNHNISRGKENHVNGGTAVLNLYKILISELLVMR